MIKYSLFVTEYILDVLFKIHIKYRIDKEKVRKKIQKGL